MTDTAKLLALCDETEADSCFEPLTSSNLVKWATRAQILARALKSRLTARQVTPTREQIMGIVCLSKSTDEAIDRIIALTAGRVER